MLDLPCMLIQLRWIWQRLRRSIIRHIECAPLSSSVSVDHNSVGPDSNSVGTDYNSEGQIQVGSSVGPDRSSVGPDSGHTGPSSVNLDNERSTQQFWTAVLLTLTPVLCSSAAAAAGLDRRCVGDRISPGLDESSVGSDNNPVGPYSSSVSSWCSSVGLDRGQKAPGSLPENR